MEILLDILKYSLPGGFLGSVISWFVGRRSRNNDMLSQLQKSINMLCTENRKVLDENIQLRRENADLKANQEEMLHKLARLTKEVERLRKVINKQNDDKTNSRGNPHADAGRVLSDGVRSCEGAVGIECEHGNGYRYIRGDVGREVHDDAGSAGEIDDSRADGGGCPDVGGEAGGTDTEPH